MHDIADIQLMVRATVRCPDSNKLRETLALIQVEDANIFSVQVNRVMVADCLTVKWILEVDDGDMESVLTSLEGILNDPACPLENSSVFGRIIGTCGPCVWVEFDRCDVSQHVCKELGRHTSFELSHRDYVQALLDGKLDRFMS